MSRRLLPGLALLAVIASGCGSSSARTQAHATAHAAANCPAASLPGYRALAKQVDAPVYCPTWLPQPLDGQIGGEYAPSPYVNKDRSYLVSFIWFEKIPTAPYEVHVNLRGYPGRTKIPTCQDTLTADGKTVRPNVPCFADPRGHVRLGNTTATVYTANQGADNWHILYAWHYHGSLYAISQHVAPPFNYAHVVRNLNRMVRGLVLVRP